MASQMHHGNDLNKPIFDTINHAIRKAMNEVTPDAAIFVGKRPNQRRFSYFLNGPINFDNEFRPEICCALFIP